MERDQNADIIRRNNPRFRQNVNLGNRRENEEEEEEEENKTNEREDELKSKKQMYRETKKQEKKEMREVNFFTFLNYHKFKKKFFFILLTIEKKINLNLYLFFKISHKKQGKNSSN